MEHALIVAGLVAIPIVTTKPLDLFRSVEQFQKYLGQPSDQEFTLLTTFVGVCELDDFHGGVLLLSLAMFLAQRVWDGWRTKGQPR